MQDTDWPQLCKLARMYSGSSTLSQPTGSSTRQSSHTALRRLPRVASVMHGHNKEKWCYSNWMCSSGKRHDGHRHRHHTQNRGSQQEGRVCCNEPLGTQFSTRVSTHNQLASRRVTLVIQLTTSSVSVIFPGSCRHVVGALVRGVANRVAYGPADHRHCFRNGSVHFCKLGDREKFFSSSLASAGRMHSRMSAASPPRGSRELP